MYLVRTYNRKKDGSKTLCSVLLRESFRENGKVKNRTISNLTHWDAELVGVLEFTIKNKESISEDSIPNSHFQIQQGKSMGAVWVLYELSKRLGIVSALGNRKAGKLALWQVISRCIIQGSRLSSVRLAGRQTACEILQIQQVFNEDDLYKNLEWLAKNQQFIEDHLFKNRNSECTDLFLYDVTSSYFEGSNNELSAYGYNRDGKKGKRQVVIGLLCDSVGTPVSIEVFTGNTSDPKTVSSQIKKISDRFHCKNITMVGDRGMLKSIEREALEALDFHYITALTKKQIQTLIAKESLQLSFFDQKLMEIEIKEGEGK